MLVRRKILGLAVVGGLVGCGLESAGLLHGASDAGADATVDAGVDVIEVDQLVPDAIADAGCVVTACPGRRCVTDTCGFYGSCDEMHKMAPSIGSGTYTFFSSKLNANYDAYCEMGVADGGWTLVGASTDGGASSSFGWKKSTGSLGNDTTPYSLGVDGIGIAFTEILVGVRGNGKAFQDAGAIYEVTLPQNFMTLTNTATATGTSAWVAGPCSTTSAPTMLAFMGHVDRGDSFFFRNMTVSDNGVYRGLQPEGITIVAEVNQCPQSGGLGNLLGVPQQGLLFVR